MLPQRQSQKMADFIEIQHKLSDQHQPISENIQTLCGRILLKFLFLEQTAQQGWSLKTPIGLEKEEGETREIQKKLCNVNILFHIHIRSQIVAIYSKLVTTVTAIISYSFNCTSFTDDPIKNFNPLTEHIKLSIYFLVQWYIFFLINFTSAGGTVHNKTLNQSSRKDRNKYLCYKCQFETHPPPVSFQISHVLLREGLSSEQVVTTQLSRLSWTSLFQINSYSLVLTVTSH